MVNMAIRFFINTIPDVQSSLWKKVFAPGVIILMMMMIIIIIIVQITFISVTKLEHPDLQ